MSNREDMIAEATDFGLKFPGNISNIKLAQMIAEFKGEAVPLEETPPPGPAVKQASKEETVDSEKELLTKNQQIAHNVFAAKRAHIAEAKAKAFKTQIVTLTNKDNRENDVMTTAYLSFENQHFGLSKNVPLDIPVELEVSLIHIAESCMMTLHKDEIQNGQRTGNKTPMRVKKYAISYSGREPS
jgi:hypothetical protein